MNDECKSRRGQVCVEDLYARLGINTYVSSYNIKNTITCSANTSNKKLENWCHRTMTQL